MLKLSNTDIADTLLRLGGSLNTREWKRETGSQSATLVLRWLDQIGVSYYPDGKIGPGRGRKLKYSLPESVEIILNSTTLPDYPAYKPRATRSDKGKPRAGNNNSIKYIIKRCPPEDDGYPLFNPGAEFDDLNVKYTQFPQLTVIEKRELSVNGEFVPTAHLMQVGSKKEVIMQCVYNKGEL